MKQRTRHELRCPIANDNLFFFVANHQDKAPLPRRHTAHLSTLFFSNTEDIVGRGANGKETRA